jgi:hypothetical protein
MVWARRGGKFLRVKFQTGLGVSALAAPRIKRPLVECRQSAPPLLSLTPKFPLIKRQRGPRKPHRPPPSQQQDSLCINPTPGILLCFHTVQRSRISTTALAAQISRCHELLRGRCAPCSSPETKASAPQRQGSLYPLLAQFFECRS